MIRCWRLDTPAQTMVLASFDGRLPEVVYWSAPLPGDENLDTLAAAGRIAPAGGMLDEVAEVSLTPERGRQFQGQPGLVAFDAAGVPVRTAFRFASEQDGEALVLGFRDDGTGLDWKLTATPYAESGVIALTLKIAGDGVRPVSLAAPVLPGPQASDEIVTFTGRWTGEFQMNRVPWAQGAHSTAAPGGRTSHERFPGILIPARGTTETGGEAWGLTLAHSGGHTLAAEELPDGRRQIRFGVDLSDADAADFPELTLIAARSGDGLNGVSQGFHEHVRQHVVRFPDPARPRPVHYNCWEAVYFDHKLDQLKALASRAAGLGVERFVLDDGWFGVRDDDTSGLGDWTIDRRKWPDGLTPLIDHVKAEGMEFGLWVEPEMINEDSDLYRAHPHWVLGPADQVRGRNQLVLDFRKPGPAEYIRDAIGRILSDYDIAYLKWDHNRQLPVSDPAQAAAVARLFAAIRADHPNVEIESCSSGGGRVDFEILSLTHRFWASDSNDALERVRIQRGASCFFPPEITGSHVGPRVCHTSGRVLPMEFRAAVAGTRAMGVEMDLAELSDAETEALTAAIARFKARRGLLHTGRLHRLESADPDVIAEMHVARDGSEFALFAAQMDASRQILARPLRLSGLDPAARYRVQLENPGEVTATLNRSDLSPLAKGEAVDLSGTALMQAGLQLPNAFPNTMWTVNGVRL
ncbi:alpha-galactosidase [Rhodobacteraceae bacterium 2CG4]|uniref:alpha-galactosidase n=1 Tax=Halovulum marinum TaxID=2662447 RepID=A0A6L5YYH7_9RHOB|nr:alpha-galactosidase [Halovulum marinum]MSU88895.1 alpha-galactosidase [Halovulum marinum]